MSQLFRNSLERVRALGFSPVFSGLFCVLQLLPVSNGTFLLIEACATLQRGRNYTYPLAIHWSLNKDFHVQTVFK